MVSGKYFAVLRGRSPWIWARLTNTKHFYKQNKFLKLGAQKTEKRITTECIVLGSDD